MKNRFSVIKILVVLMVLTSLSLFSLKYIPLSPDSFAGRTKMKLDELVYPLPLVGGLSKAVKDAYAAAIQNVRNNDLEAAEANLKKAVRLKPDFTEAWYNLGAAQTFMAMNLAREEKDRDAVLKFREAVESKKKSQSLMDKNTWYVYKEPEQENVRHDVREALRNVDELLANEQMLLLLLKIYR
jgi:tetratricopeptide (TPR) repeat protein